MFSCRPTIRITIYLIFYFHYLLTSSDELTSEVGQLRGLDKENEGIRFNSFLSRKKASCSGEAIAISKKRLIKIGLLDDKLFSN